MQMVPVEGLVQMVPVEGLAQMVPVEGLAHMVPVGELVLLVVVALDVDVGWPTMHFLRPLPSISINNNILKY